MDEQQQNVMAEGVGQALGEVLGAFVLIVNGLRKQPGFDDAAFRGELEQQLAGELTRMQRHLAELLLKEPPRAHPLL